MFEQFTIRNAASSPTQACASSAQNSDATGVAAATKAEISAIAEADTAATETDGNPWAVAEDEERHHEADDLVAELRIRLKSELEKPQPALECKPADVDLSLPK